MVQTVVESMRTFLIFNESCHRSKDRHSSAAQADLCVPCLLHPSSCTAPKCHCAAAMTQLLCWLSRPLAPTEETRTFAILSTCPSRTMVTWPVPPASPRCEGCEAVDMAGPLGQEGLRQQQPITASWCQQGFRPPSPDGQVTQEAGEGGEEPYQDLHPSSLPPC